MIQVWPKKANTSQALFSILIFKNLYLVQRDIGVIRLEHDRALLRLSKIVNIFLHLSLNETLDFI